MIPRAALALAALLALGARAFAQLDDVSRDLLADSGYELREDGKVWDKIAQAPVGAEELPYVLDRLASARRLKALLELNLIINRGSDDKSLSDADRDKIRAIVRRNWPILGLSTRKDFRSYFTPEELDSLDKVPVRFARHGIEPLKDPEPLPVTAYAPATTPALAVSTPTAPAIATSTPTVPTVAVSTLAAPVIALSTPSIPVVAVSTSARIASSAPDLGVLKPWTPPTAPIPPAAPAPSVPAAKPAAAPALPTTPAPPAAVAPAAPPAPALPPPPSISAAEYAKFAAEGPYTRESRELLEMLGRRAPEFCLPLLRRTVVNAVPQIVFDSARTGSDPRAGKASDSGSLVIALSPGPLSVERRHGLFGRESAILPDSPQAWTALGLPKPALPSASRGTYSPWEQAGELLERLLLEGLRREGLSASPYAAHRWARLAKLIFWASLKEETGHDDFLDPDRRAELAEWLGKPDESADMSVAQWSSAREWILDPRHGTPEAERLAAAVRSSGSCARAALEDGFVEAARRRAARVGTLEALLDMELIDADAAHNASKAAVEEEAAQKSRLLASPACPPADPARAAALSRSAALLAEAARIEKSWREKRAQGASHAH